MQLWRENRDTINPLYILQHVSGTEDELSQTDASLYEYNLKTPIPIQTGYVLGVSLPKNRRLLLHFHDFGDGKAPISYLSPVSTTVIVVSATGPSLQYLPLIVPVIGKQTWALNKLTVAFHLFDHFLLQLTRTRI